MLVYLDANVYVYDTICLCEGVCMNVYVCACV